MNKTLPIFFVLSFAIILFSCSKETSCFDGIQNQGELGIDCSGPCVTCGVPPSCNDGILNQGEFEIDCGGPCAHCAPNETCFDGIQNQNETDIDCGGVWQPCNSCTAPDIYNGIYSYKLNYSTVVCDLVVTEVVQNNFTVDGTNLSANTKLSISLHNVLGNDDFIIGTNARVSYSQNGQITHSSDLGNFGGSIAVTDFSEESDCKQLAGIFEFIFSDIQNDQIIVHEGIFNVSY